jgi:hypothetical protein
MYKALLVFVLMNGGAGVGWRLERVEWGSICQLPPATCLRLVAPPPPQRQAGAAPPTRRAWGAQPAPAAAGAFKEGVVLLCRSRRRFSDLIQIWPLCVVAYRATSPSCAYRDNDQIYIAAGAGRWLIREMGNKRAALALIFSSSSARSQLFFSQHRLYLVH